MSAGHAQLQPDDKLDDIVGRADSDLYRFRRSRRAGDKLRTDAGLLDLGAAGPATTERREPSVACGVDSVPLIDRRCRWSLSDGPRSARMSFFSRSGMLTSTERTAISPSGLAAKAALISADKGPERSRVEPVAAPVSAWMR